MKLKSIPAIIFTCLAVFIAMNACKKTKKTESKTYPAVQAAFGNSIDLNNLQNYAAQTRPTYITKDNSGSNPITNAGATLGRVLFYDVKLSVNNTISCGTCHQQKLAFGENKPVTQGVNGLTGRHTMRLVNARFGQETKFFWDERAASLEFQTTQPIQNHDEMGYSGKSGDPGIADLIAKLQAVDYYKELFTFVYGDATITEARMQTALSQFVRSIQSFDSKFDAGFSQVNNLNADFPNYTAQENMGKHLFLDPPPGAPGPPPMTGAGCQGCHRAPEFDIDPASLNNGVIRVAADSTKIDLTNTRTPSLRDLLNSTGSLNGPLMHNGEFTSLLGVVNHYNAIPKPPANTNLDNRLMPGGTPQSLNLTLTQKQALVAFLATLSGTDVYINKKWSSPFP